MLLSYETFSLFAIFSIFIPMAAAIILMMILAFEKQIDTLSFEKKQALLENTLQESKYMQLNQQIHPHFLFNTINLMLGLARLKRIDTLIKAMETLSLFLKFKYQVKEPLIPFEQELKYTEYYLKIQELRFLNRLAIVTEIETGTLSCQVPPYLLQTLAENAFKHGLEKKPGPLCLTIRASIQEECMILKVEDNGLGTGELTFEEMLTKGSGMANAQKRLRLLFKEATLLLEPGKEEGAVVTASIPLQNTKMEEETG
ncbi:histidine kinase [Bacillus infantis]|uniref:sensor histidine kinase n=1 Tax=Bacillus infantis TaxID=324767 RepID=UPI001CD52F0A|nr:histidine kinase [Bacillus infantis]MCA1033722.1 histidine kinase [Bacillus infantis]